MASLPPGLFPAHRAAAACFAISCRCSLVSFSALALPGGRATGLALPVVHRLVAALILGQVAALLAVLVRAGGAAADPARRATRLETVTLPSGP